MPTNLLTRLLQHLTGFRILLIFVLLILPTVFAPYHSDDFFHLLLLSDDKLLQRGGDGSLFGLFSFIDTDSENRRQMISLGVLPWWTADSFYFRFWRPLAELTHWLDYRVFGPHPLIAHLHSIAWFLLLAWVVWMLAQRTYAADVRQAGKNGHLFMLLALALFIWDGQHVATITWIANRNALIAAVLAFAALLQHMRWREGSGWSAALFSHVLLALALLAGEIALSIGAYLLLYALLLDRAGRWRGFLALLGYLVVAVAYLLVHRQLGFGADTSLTFYISPFSHPLGFLEIAIQRFPVYVASAFLPVPSGISWAGGETMRWLSWIIQGLAFALLPVIVYLGYRLVHGHRVAAFWLISGLLSIVPVCAALPQDRLALFMTVGVDLFLAWLLFQRLINLNPPAHLRTAFVRKLTVGLGIIHLLLSPLHLLAGTSFMWLETRRLEHHALHFNTQPLAGKQLVIFQLSIGQSSTLLGMRHWHGVDIPDSSLLLASDEGSMSVDVVSDHVLVINRPIGFSIGHESAFRDVNRSPLKVDDKTYLDGTTITVLRVNQAGYPDRIRLDLDADIYGTDVTFYTQKGLDLAPVHLPAIGETLDL